MTSQKHSHHLSNKISKTNPDSLLFSGSGFFCLNVFVNYLPDMIFLQEMSYLRSAGWGEGQAERQRTMPCEIRPIVVDTPQTALKRRVRSMNGKRGDPKIRRQKRAV